MAHIENITAETELSQFLTEEQIKECIISVDKIQSELTIIKSLLEEEMTSGGLSETAYTDDMGVPLLYNEANDILKPWSTSDKVFEHIKQKIKTAGANHRYEEADIYYKKIKEKYENLLQSLKTAVRNYNYEHTNQDDETDIVKEYDYILVYGSIEEKPRISHNPKFKDKYEIIYTLHLTLQYFSKLQAAKLYFDSISKAEGQNIDKEEPKKGFLQRALSTVGQVVSGVGDGLLDFGEDLFDTVLYTGGKIAQAVVSPAEAFLTDGKHNWSDGINEFTKSIVGYDVSGNIKEWFYNTEFGKTIDKYSAFKHDDKVFNMISGGTRFVSLTAASAALMGAGVPAPKVISYVTLADASSGIGDSVENQYNRNEDHTVNTVKVLGNVAIRTIEGATAGKAGRIIKNFISLVNLSYTGLEQIVGKPTPALPAPPTIIKP